MLRVMENKRIFSYIDTILRVIHVNVTLDELGDVPSIRTRIEKMDTSPTAKRLFLKHLLERLPGSHEKTYRDHVHEFHHYWQSLFYPFLYFVHVIEYMTIQEIAKSIRLTNIQIIPINGIKIHPEFRTNLEYLTISFTLVWDSEQLSLQQDPSGNKNNGSVWESFTFNDFIEDPTSIFEYKMTTADPNGGGYSAWLKNPANNAYKKLYRFLEKIVGSENAYNILPMLVQVAFHTTEPASGLCNVFNYWYRMKNLKAKSFFPTFHDYLDTKFLLEIHYPVKDIDFNEPIALSHLPTVYIGEKIIENLIAFNFSVGQELNYYPLADHFRKYQANRSSSPEVENFLFDPKPNIGSLLREFEPFAIHQFIIDFHGRNSTITVGKDFAHKKFNNDTWTFSQLLKELMKSVTTTQAIISDHLNVLPHNCHHLKCPYYPLGKCRGWNAIPQNYETCGFPFWFGWFYNFRIDVARNEYIKLFEGEVEEYRKQYFINSYRGQEHEYLMSEEDPEEYILTISQEHIREDPEGKRFEGFIDLLCQKNGKIKQDLFGKITLDFYSYDNDKRELFEIPEVVDWISKTKKHVPEFLLFINFNKEPEEKLFLFVPMFVPFQKRGLEDGILAIEFIQPDYQDFWMGEMELLHRQMIKENYDEYLILSQLKKILIHVNNN